MAEPDSKDTPNTQDITQEKSEPDYGYKWFPERGKERTPFQKLRYGRQSSYCYRHITSCMQTDRTIAMIVNALNSYGCKFNRRHISCEMCNEGQAAYDFRARQVVFCQNKVKSSGYCGILAHELIHAFDDCRAKLDYKNIDHIACTEIRAANLTQCDFFNGLVCGVMTPGLDKSQQECVRGHAMYSLMMGRNLSKEQALTAIDRVWDRCYNDLEPIGRRYKPNKDDRNIASQEGKKFGF